MGLQEMIVQMRRFRVPNSIQYLQGQPLLPLGPAGLDQGFPMSCPLPWLSRAFLQRQKEDVLWNEEQALFGHELPGMKQQVSRRSGIPHQMAAIGFAQGEEST